ncbi:MAG: hypothetical protein VYE47_08925, partial [Pseudomonadota bacterium]|nr:hypothetical protein [Pseudomonadota bacterium]
MEVHKWLCLCLVLTSMAGCVTYHNDVTLKYEPKNVGVNIENMHEEGDIRQYFSDGITTYEGDYYNIAQNLIAYTLESLKEQQIQTDKIVALEVLSLTCNGHYVPDCRAFVRVEVAGTQFNIDSEKVTSYPI